MKKLLFYWLLPLLISCGNRDNNDFDGKVVSIADGDTFTMLAPDNTQVKVRLHGIDCPERAQDYGTVARQRLSDLLFGKGVNIEEKDRDRYGRVVAIAYDENGINVNEQLLKEGLAWHYKAYDKNEAWTDMEAAARRQKIGLWAKRNPIPPWEFRKIKRSANAAP